MKTIPILQNHGNQMGVLDVEVHLSVYPAALVTGFYRCGKSTLSEALDLHFKNKGVHVLLQSAQAWVKSQRSRKSWPTPEHSFYVDEEINAALELLKAKGGIWIIDNSEVLLAHASENALHEIQNQLIKGSFRLVLIRNRFVLENSGWFHEREMMLELPLPYLELQALNQETAIDIATTLFDDHNRQRRGEWLAEWSGGIMGLIHELYRFTPEWADSDMVPDHIHEYIARVHQRMELARPIRSAIINALSCETLPPHRLLTDEARIELGYLSLLGMISPNHGDVTPTFQGRYWELVAKTLPYTKKQIHKDYSDQALNLEILIGASGLRKSLCQDLCLLTADGSLAEAFANTLYWHYNAPRLVYNLADFLIEALGRIGLRLVLTAAGEQLPISANSKQLAKKLLHLAGIIK